LLRNKQRIEIGAQISLTNEPIGTLQDRNSYVKNQHEIFTHILVKIHVENSIFQAIFTVFAAISMAFGALMASRKYHR